MKYLNAMKNSQLSTPATKPLAEENAQTSRPKAKTKLIEVKKIGENEEAKSQKATKNQEMSSSQDDSSDQSNSDDQNASSDNSSSSSSNNQIAKNTAYLNQMQANNPTTQNYQNPSPNYKNTQQPYIENLLSKHTMAQNRFNASGQNPYYKKSEHFVKQIR